MFTKGEWTRKLKKIKKLKNYYSDKIKFDTFIMDGTGQPSTFQANIKYKRHRRHFANSFNTSYCSFVKVNNTQIKTEVPNLSSFFWGGGVIYFWPYFIFIISINPIYTIYNRNTFISFFLSNSNHIIKQRTLRRLICFLLIWNWCAQQYFIYMRKVLLEYCSKCIHQDPCNRIFFSTYVNLAPYQHRQTLQNVWLLSLYTSNWGNMRQ